MVTAVGTKSTRHLSVATPTPAFTSVGVDGGDLQPADVASTGVKDLSKTTV